MNTTDTTKAEMDRLFGEYQGLAKTIAHAFKAKLPQHVDVRASELLSEANYALLLIIRKRIEQPEKFASEDHFKNYANRRLNGALIDYFRFWNGKKNNKAHKCFSQSASEHGRKTIIEELAETLADNRSTPVPDQAAFLVDFPEWITDQLDARRREIAIFMIEGNGRSATATKFGVTKSRISQVRRQLRDSWLRYQGDEIPDSDHEQEVSYAA